MADEQLHIQLTGMDDVDVTLPALVKKLKELTSSLEAVDLEVHQEKRTTFYVAHAEHNSPLKLAIAGASNQLNFSPERTFDVFINMVGHTKENAWPDGYSQKLKRKLKNLLDGLGTNFSELTFRYGGRTHCFEYAAAQPERETNDQLTYLSSVTGSVDYLDIHNQTNSFKVYPMGGAEYILCKFKEELKAQVVSAVNKTVTVSGLFKHKTCEPYPHLIKVHSLEIHIENPEGESDFSALFGVAPEATGSMSSEAFVRRLRNEWG